MVNALSAFPFLTAGDFDWACRDLAERACGGGWSSARLVTQVNPLPAYMNLEA